MLLLEAQSDTCQLSTCLIWALQLDYEVNRIPKIRLAGSDEESYMGDLLFVYGFGWTGPQNSTYNDIPYATSNNLRKGSVNMVSNVDCTNTYGFPELNSTMFICTDGADPCFVSFKVLYAMKHLVNVVLVRAMVELR